MNLKNSIEHFGWVSIFLHWIMAIGLIGLYALGIYMVELDYYDEWYHKGLTLHKEIGMILMVLFFIRLAWIYSHSKPTPIDTNKWKILLAKLAHSLLYLLTLLLMASGYLISTTKGQGIDIFNLFEVSSLIRINTENSELLGSAHDILASLFILMVALHSTAALIHHFIFKDNTLKRMLWAHNTHHQQDN